MQSTIITNNSTVRYTRIARRARCLCVLQKINIVQMKGNGLVRFNSLCDLAPNSDTANGIVFNQIVTIYELLLYKC